MERFGELKYMGDSPLFLYYEEQYKGNAVSFQFTVGKMPSETNQEALVRIAKDIVQQMDKK